MVFEAYGSQTLDNRCLNYMRQTDKYDSKVLSFTDQRHKLVPPQVGKKKLNRLRDNL